MLCKKLHMLCKIRQDMICDVFSDESGSEEVFRLSPCGRYSLHNKLLYHTAAHSLLQHTASYHNTLATVTHCSILVTATLSHTLATTTCTFL